MSTCQSCGGVIGQDCFNQQECMEITQSMARQYEQNPPKQVDWDKLRVEFFMECVDAIHPPISNYLIGRINLAPHDMFEWFKKKIQTNE